MRKTNKFGYLSLLGIVGFLGFFTDHKMLFWFFGYFGYAYYFKVIADEMFKEHILKASAISFLILLLIMMITIMVVTITGNIQFAPLGLYWGFLIGNLSFAVFHTFYEIKESAGAKDENI